MVWTKMGRKRMGLGERPRAWGAQIHRAKMRRRRKKKRSRAS